MKSDIDAYLLDKSGNSLASSTMNNLAKPGSPDCDQFVPSVWVVPEAGRDRGLENEGAETEVKLAIDRCFGAVCNPGGDPAAEPRIKLALNQNGRGVTATEYLESNGEDLVGPTVYGHSGAAAAVTLGAIRAGVTTKPEPYSSRGPVKHYFGPSLRLRRPSPCRRPRSNGRSEARCCCHGRRPDDLLSSPSRRNRDLPILWHLGRGPACRCGRRPCPPGEPGPDPGAVQTGLAETALPVGAFGPDAVGAGLIDAHSMLETSPCRR